MAVTIADLEINIQSTGNEMIATFTRLATKLNALSTHLDKATSSMKKVSKAMSDTGKEAKKAGEGAEKGAKGLGRFASSVLRIMKYRAIRAVLRTITQGFREGVQNIALYSAAMNEMDASKANNVMSAYASMGAQIKNSLGAAVMPLLANLLPAIQKVADVFMDAAEAVARFFATLNGQTTYTAANREYWVDYAKNLNKATGAAKELKRTILGFDEINALNSQSSGGSGKTTPNYKDMFVEKTNDWFGLKDTFEWILAAVTAIGAGILAWKMSTALIAGLDKLGMIGNWLKVGVGLVLTVIAVKWGIDAGKAFAKGDWGEGLKKTAGTVLAGGIGGALIGSAVPGIGTGVGFVIGVGVGLVATVVSFIMNSAYEAHNSGINEIIPRVLERHGLIADEVSDERLKAHIDVAADIVVSFTNIVTENKAKMDDVEAGYAILRKIFSFQYKDNKTAEEIARINALCRTFNSLSLGDARIEWNETTGQIKTSREELARYLKDYEKKIKLEAYESIAVEALKAKIKAEREIADLAKLQLYYEEMAIRSEGDLRDEYNKKYDEATAAVWQLHANLQEFDATYSDAIGHIADITTEAANGARNVGRELENTFDPDKIINPRKWKTAMINAFKGLPSIDFTVSNGKINPHVAGISAYATGGFVPSGDLFVAGEAGAELIMAAPNGSEVVNMAQFERAMMNAVSAAGGQGGDWTIVIQDENGSVKSRQVITAAERANRRDGRTVIPVGVY